MILAPILIPMLYAIGFSPALTTVAYRIGDSATNAIAPISSDVALIVGLLVSIIQTRVKHRVWERFLQAVCHMQ